MDADEPRVGQIVDHHFLWADEASSGQAEGRKARPCLIVAVEQRKHGGLPRVTLLPVTSQPPRAGTTAIALPANVKLLSGLARARPAWVILDDANVFDWPGYDLVPQPGGKFARGVVTRGFFELVRSTVTKAHARGRLRKVERD